MHPRHRCECEDEDYVAIRPAKLLYTDTRPAAVRPDSALHRAQEGTMAKHALCVGINDYPGTGMDLQGCVNDAHDWAAALEARDYTVRLLLDRRATKSALMAAIRKLVKDAQASDSIVLTFSGHGTYQPDRDGDETDGYDEALCPYDLTTRGALIDDTLHALFLPLHRQARLVLISDSCHSGTVTRAAPADADADGPRPRFMPMGNWLPQSVMPRARAGTSARIVTSPGEVSAFKGVVANRPGDLLFAGCREGPNNYSYDAHFRGRANGAFTYYALKTLKTLPARATYTDWHQRICESLPSASFPQSPQLVGTPSVRKRRVFA